MKKLLAALLALLMMVPLAQAETGVRWIDGGNGESWCVYYITETDKLRSVGSQQSQLSVSALFIFISTSTV